MTVCATATPVTFDGVRLAGYREHPRMSQETNAFDAEVHIAGNRAGILRNSGRGGESTFTPDNAAAMKAFEQAQHDFPGIHLPEYRLTLALIDCLAEIGSLATSLHSPTRLTALTDTPAEQIILNAALMTVHELPRQDGTDADLAEMLRQLPQAQTLTYTQRDHGGYWLHTITR